METLQWSKFRHRGYILAGILCKLVQVGQIDFQLESKYLDIASSMKRVSYQFRYRLQMLIRRGKESRSIDLDRCPELNQRNI